MPTNTRYFLITSYLPINGNIDVILTDLTNNFGLHWYAYAQELTENGTKHFHLLVALLKSISKVSCMAALSIKNLKVSLVYQDIFKKLNYLRKQGGIMTISSQFPDTVLEQWQSIVKFEYEVHTLVIPQHKQNVTINIDMLHTPEQIECGLPFAHWMKACAYMINRWIMHDKSKMPSFFPNIYLWGCSGFGKTYGIKNVLLPLANINPGSIYMTVPLAGQFFLENFEPPVHRVLFLDECNHSSFDAERMAQLKSITSQGPFELNEKHVRHHYYHKWDGITIITSNHPPEVIFGNELPNMIRRFVFIEAVQKNNPQMIESMPISKAKALGLTLDEYQQLCGADISVMASVGAR